MTKPSARDRLLDAADDLFYAEGVQTVGIDRVIERAGVAKASLYHAFRSKDDLVGAYLAGREERVLTRIRDHVARAGTPRERLLAVFEAQAAWTTRPEFHGCPFAAAAAEAKPDSAADRQVRHYRAEVREILVQLAADAGAADPPALALQLHLIFDGVAHAIRLGDDRRAVAATTAATATMVIDQAISAA